jgi:hypothetical protein
MLMLSWWATRHHATRQSDTDRHCICSILSVTLLVVTVIAMLVVMLVFRLTVMQFALCHAGRHLGCNEGRHAVMIS